MAVVRPGEPYHVVHGGAVGGFRAHDGEGAFAVVGRGWAGGGEAAEHAGDEDGRQRGQQAEGGTHRIGTSRVTVVALPPWTAVMSRVEVPGVDSEAPRADTWVGVIGVTSSRRGGRSPVVASISTASTVAGVMPSGSKK